MHVTRLFRMCGPVRGLPAALAAAALLTSVPTVSAQDEVPVSAVAGRAAIALRNPLETRFVREQLQHPRVMQARADARFGLKRLYRDRGLAYPAAEIFLRVFKRERVLELWVRTPDARQFSLLREYRICALAGEIGPKRRQGDNQTPEGFYEIDAFNPSSQYLLSLHVNYPNASDRVMGRVPLGGDIYIHGGCKTIGCIAIEDEQIKELYWAAVEARALGQTRIPVHIFPARLDDAEMELLTRIYGARRDLVAFWNTLRPGYDYFERHRVPPMMRVNARGQYQVGAAGNRAADPGPPQGPTSPSRF
ncbi:MAG: L,D-transpeptidase family protein [Gemmatimonadetes bacterium]|nr:L,D-transpeptidase family protein [Gemmatimonadota bacterium]